VRRQAGLKSGREIEFKVSGAVISIRPKLPTAEDEYTPEQRRITDARLANADADINFGRVSKAFRTTASFVADLNEEAATLSAKKTRRPAK
jgi:hypothetical protein